jgi:hypothetical protein
MDANRLRARFIKRQLQRALAASDITFASKAAREFRRYVEWFKALLSERDKKRIATQLSLLENKVARHERSNSSDPLVHCNEPDSRCEQQFNQKGGFHES